MASFYHSVAVVAHDIAIEASSKSTSDIARTTCKSKPSLRKILFAKSATVPLLIILVLLFFAVDASLFGSSGMLHYGSRGRVLFKQVASRTGSGKLFFLDCALCFAFVAFIYVKLACRSTRDVDEKQSISPNSIKLTRTNDIHRQRKKYFEPNEGSTDRRRKVRFPTTERSTTLVRCNKEIDSAARQGDVAKAGGLLMEFESLSKSQPGNQPDTVSYNIIIRACAKQGDCRGAEQWFSRMKSKGLQPTICTYNTILDACAKADKADACESWFQRMLDSGIEANVISYATVIYARARHGEETLAESWLNRMLKAGVIPDSISYNAMIHACGVNGNAVGAEKWIEAMQARGLDATVTTYTTVIDACAKAGDVVRAEKWLEAMLSAKVQPNVVSFSAMIDACAKTCDPARAEYWHYRMASLGITPNAHSYSAVINACAKAGNAAMAEEWLGRSEEAGVATDVVVYSSVIDACGKVGNAELAMKVFERMQANGIRPHIVACAALARPFAYRGDFASVERIAVEMSAVGIAPNEYFIYAQLLSYATSRPPQAQRAEQCFRHALKLGVKANDHVVGALARAVGRQTCVHLMSELCNGRPLPRLPRRECGIAGYKVKPHT